MSGGRGENPVSATRPTLPNHGARINGVPSIAILPVDACSCFGRPGRRPSPARRPAHR